MSTNTIALKEKHNQRKGMTFSVAFNTIIVLLALYPFLTQDTPDPEPAEFVEIQFVDFKSSSTKSAEGDMREKNAPEKKVEEAVEEKVVEETAPEPVEDKPEPTPEVKPEPTPQRAPVVTSHKPAPPIRTSPEKTKEKMKVPPVRTKKPTVKPKPNPKPRVPAKTTTNKKKETSNKKTKETGKTSSKKQDGKETKSNSGGGEKAENGTDATTGKTDSGTKVGDFPGDGLFNRKVIYRADVKKVTSEEGKIVIDLCVNRDGRVVYSKFNKAASSIKTTSVIRKALEIAQQYRFEKDYTAPNKQCGKLTFIFEIEEE